MTISQRDAGRLVRQLEPFKAGNVYAEFRNGLYVVYSYGEHWPMALCYPEDGHWIVNADKYSISTGCQRSKMRLRELPDADFEPCRYLLRRIHEGTKVHAVTQRLIECAYA